MSKFKVGDRVLVEAVVSASTPGDRGFPVEVSVEGTSHCFWPRDKTVRPIPPTPTPAEKLRAAAEVLGAGSRLGAMLLEEADRLEAEYAPKPTLREAVERAFKYIDANTYDDAGVFRLPCDTPSIVALREALAREEASKS